MSEYMTPDADTLRGMAKAFMMVGSHEQAGTCLAGAGALETLAADTLEYGVEYTGVNHGHRHTGSNASWHAKRKHAEREYRQMARSGMKPRLVARRVSTPWEATDE